MASEEGIVTGVEGSYALVKVTRQASCAHCPSAASCHLGTDRAMVVKAENIAGAQVGQRVRLFISPRSIVAASFLIYILPLFGLLLGAFVGRLLWIHVCPDMPSELLSAGIGLLAMAGIFFGIRLYDRHYRTKEDFIPKIVEVL